MTEPPIWPRMRPIAKRQSAVNNPLNGIFGTEASVRILRVLSRTSEPIGAGDLARATSLNPSGVRRTIEQLIEVGILTSVGSGSRRMVRIRTQHPLARPLRDLFVAEAARLPHIREAIAAEVGELNPLPLSVWFHGPVTVGADKPGEALTVGVLGDDAELGVTVEALQSQITAIEKRYDLTIGVRGFSRADFSTMGALERDEILRAAIVWGPHPGAFLEEPAERKVRAGKRTHDALDARGLALASAVARKLRTDPSLVERARKRIAARMRTASAGERKELKEWDQILRGGSPARLRQLLSDTGPRATRLRQTLPFLDALTREERDTLLAPSSQE
jgi:DNA-binding transcriptional ArsR family regulator